MQGVSRRKAFKLEVDTVGRLCQRRYQGYSHCADYLQYWAWVSKLRDAEGRAQIVRWVRESLAHLGSASHHWGLLQDYLRGLVVHVLSLQYSIACQRPALSKRLWKNDQQAYGLLLEQVATEDAAPLENADAQVAGRVRVGLVGDSTRSDENVNQCRPRKSWIRARSRR